MPSPEAKLLILLAVAAYAATALLAAMARHSARDVHRRSGAVLLSAGISLSLALLILRLASGHVPTGSGFDTFVVMALLTGAATAYFRALDVVPRAAIVLAAAAAGWAALAVALSGPAYREFAHDFWTVAHVVLASSAVLAFASAAAAGWLYLRKHRQLRTKDPDLFRSRLPSLERLDRFLRHALPVAFALVSATIVTGLVDAFEPPHQGYFRNWLTHPKVLTAALAWLLCAAALHSAHARRFRGRAAAVLSAAAFLLLMAVLIFAMLLPKA